MNEEEFKHYFYSLELRKAYMAGLRRAAEIAKAEAMKGGFDHQGHINPVIAAIEAEIKETT